MPVKEAVKKGSPKTGAPLDRFKLLGKGSSGKAPKVGNPLDRFPLNKINSNK
jgi:hypothetical protein